MDRETENGVTDAQIIEQMAGQMGTSKDGAADLLARLRAKREEA